MLPNFEVYPNQAVPDHCLKSPKFHFSEGMHFLNLSTLFHMITICYQHQAFSSTEKTWKIYARVKKSATLNHSKNVNKQHSHSCYDFWTIVKTNHSMEFRINVKQYFGKNCLLPLNCNHWITLFFDIFFFWGGIQSWFEILWEYYLKKWHFTSPWNGLMGLLTF